MQAEAFVRVQAQERGKKMSEAFGILLLTVCKLMHIHRKL